MRVLPNFRDGATGELEQLQDSKAVGLTSGAPVCWLGMSILNEHIFPTSGVHSWWVTMTRSGLKFDGRWVEMADQEPALQQVDLQLDGQKE